MCKRLARLAEPGRERPCENCGSIMQPRRKDQRYCKSTCKVRANSISSRFGISPREYSQMLEEQNGRCAGCGDEFGDERPVLDHCHTTGRLRGFLHVRCNIGIGEARDDPETLFGWQVHLLRSAFDLRDLCVKA